MRKREIVDLIKVKMRKNKLTAGFYVAVKRVKKGTPYSEMSIRTVVPKKDESLKQRYNLVLPVFQNERIFGGITTAIKIFLMLNENDSCDMRILVFGNETYNKQLTYHLDGFKHNNPQKGVYFLEENNVVDVRKNDIFVVTSWNTAYSFLKVFDWQVKEYEIKNRNILYLIQDFEPGFYAWSSEYVLADSTYRSCADSMIAIFNSKELYYYFKDNKFSFKHEFFFNPSLNATLKRILLSNLQQDRREKRILVYGRQNAKRNLFGLLLDSLRIWSRDYEKADEWEIISIGDVHETIKLAKNEVVSRGKLSLDDYGNIMLSSYVGVSLMASPHPSYPPLEMSTFGVRTITNMFANKDLSGFNENIISINMCTPQYIASVLISLCEDYYSGYVSKPVRMESYLNDNSIESVVRNVKEVCNGSFS